MKNIEDNIEYNPTTFHVTGFFSVLYVYMAMLMVHVFGELFNLFFYKETLSNQELLMAVVSLSLIFYVLIIFIKLLANSMEQHFEQINLRRDLKNG